MRLRFTKTHDLNSGASYGERHQKEEMEMTEESKTLLRAIIKALNVPRDRLGRLQGDLASTGDMNGMAVKYQIPHGGYDRVDQAVMLLQYLVQDEIKSIMDHS
jgi:hypothetical protein